MNCKFVSILFWVNNEPNFVLSGLLDETALTHSTAFQLWPGGTEYKFI